MKKKHKMELNNDEWPDILGHFVIAAKGLDQDGEYALSVVAVMEDGEIAGFVVELEELSSVVN